MTTLVILIVLAMLWAAVLVPPLVRGRGGWRRRSNDLDLTARLGTLDPNRARRASVTPLRTPRRVTQPVSSISPPGSSLALPSASNTVESAIAMPSSLDDARRRRRDVLVGLAALSVLTLLAAAAVGGLAVVAHLLVDIALLGYVMLVAQRQRLAEERRQKVTPIRPPVAPMQPGNHAELLHSSGS